MHLHSADIILVMHGVSKHCSIIKYANFMENVFYSTIWKTKIVFCLPSTRLLLSR